MYAPLVPQSPPKSMESAWPVPLTIALVAPVRMSVDSVPAIWPLVLMVVVVWPVPMTIVLYVFPMMYAPCAREGFPSIRMEMPVWIVRRSMGVRNVPPIMYVLNAWVDLPFPVDNALCADTHVRLVILMANVQLASCHSPPMLILMVIASPAMLLTVSPAQPLIRTNAQAVCLPIQWTRIPKNARFCAPLTYAWNVMMFRCVRCVWMAMHPMVMDVSNVIKHPNA